MRYPLKILKTFNEKKKKNAWDKCSGLVHWEDPEESGGEGGGRGESGWGYM